MSGRKEGEMRRERWEGEGRGKDVEGWKNVWDEVMVEEK